MIRVEFTRPGQILYGNIETNMEGRKFRPMYTVVAVNKENGLIDVKNGRGEMRTIEARDLFTQAGIERYWKGKYFELLKLLKKTVGTATAASPELKKEFDDLVDNK